MDVALFETIGGLIERRDLDAASALLEGRLAHVADPSFLPLARLSFHGEEDFARSLTEFTQRAVAADCIALYFEMNEFDINPDLWYADPFGYNRDAVQADEFPEYLSHWSHTAPVGHIKFVLRGLEPVQTAFKAYRERNDRAYFEERVLENEIDDVPSLLTMIRYLQFAARIEKIVRLPPGLDVFFSAHDFDMFHSFRT